MNTSTSGPTRKGSTGARPLAGTGALLRLALRRDRVVLPVWVAALALVVVSGVGSIGALYDTAAARADLVRSLAANGSLRTLIGVVHDDSLGGLIAWRLGGFAAVGAAAMSLIVVVRHTREEEETGRQEMLSSAMVGRRAPLTSALLTALVANAALALIVTAGLAGPTGSPTGALALGLTVGGVGMLFASLAALTAQLTESARLAKGLAAAALGLAYALRAAGDASDGSSLGWLSPLGWAANVRPYADERWPVLLLLAAAVLVQTAAAYVLAGRRDLGMSFLPTRPGPATGRLTGAAGLARRLQRGALAGWATAFLLAGIAFGALADGAADLVGDNDAAREIFERMGGQSGLTDAFLASMTGLFGMVAALYATASVLRLHTEETSQRAEPILAGAVGRIRWAAGHLLVAFGGAALLLALTGLGLSLGHGRDPGPILAAALVQIPAVWLLAALAVLLYGAFPRAALASWALTGLCLTLGWIGPALDLPAWALRLSPFGHLPKLPGESMDWPPVLILTALAAVAVTAGLAALRRRDLRS